jgi:large repetitive protein
LTQLVTFTVNVSAVLPGAGTPSGTVTFLDNGSTIGTGTLSSGVATFTTSALAVGNHPITASYGGDGNFNGSSSAPLTQTVNKANSTTTLASAPNPSSFNQTVVFTATVVGTGAISPTGTVTFTDQTAGQTLGTVSAGGSGGAATATLSISTLTAGSHNIQASYSGDGTFNSSSSTSLAQTVNKANTSTGLVASQNPSNFGQPVSFTVSVSGANGGTPTGSVTFTNTTTGQTLGTVTLVNRQALFTTSTLPVGTDNVQASYSGDPNFNASSSSINQTVNATTSTTVQSSQNPSPVGQAVTFTATVSSAGGTPTGTVTFSVDGGPGTAVGLSGGQATFTTSTLAVGTHTITASYAANGSFLGSSGSVSQVVNKATPAITGLTSSLNPSTFGQSVTFTATVTGSGSLTPTGSVTFTDQTNSQTLGTINLVGTGNNSAQAIFTTSALTAGSHSILATYSGDPNFNASTASLTQTVNKAATSTGLVSSLNPSVSGQSVIFTATVSSSSGTPTGSVTFTDQTTNQTLGTIMLANRQAVLTISTLAPGTHMILASYSGDTNFAASSTNLNQVVNKATITISLVSSSNPSQAGQSVTFTATVTGSAAGDATPTGSVSFVIGGPQLRSRCPASRQVSPPRSQLAATRSRPTIAATTISAAPANRSRKTSSKTTAVRHSSRTIIRAISARP